jgi:regulatory protein
MSRRVAASRPLDRAALHEKALRYLDRFDATATRLGAVLQRFVDRSIEQSEAARRNEAYLWCEQVVARCVEAGLVDDSRYASSVALGMRRHGASARAIVERLVTRGVDRETALATLKSLSGEGQADSELEAARALVRRRRLGHYRSESERGDRHKKDLAALARAGFSFETARRALELPSDDGGDF